MKLLPLQCSQCGGQLDPDTFTCKSCGTSFVSKLGNITFVQIEVGDMDVCQINSYINNLKKSIEESIGVEEKIIYIPTRHGVGNITVKQYKFLKEE